MTLTFLKNIKTEISTKVGVEQERKEKKREYAMAHASVL